LTDQGRRQFGIACARPPPARETPSTVPRLTVLPQPEAIMQSILSHRRALLGLLPGSALYFALPTSIRATSGAPLAQLLAALEARHSGRLGVFVSGQHAFGAGTGHRADQRFGMCSTFKLLLVAMILREAQHGRLDMSHSIRFDKTDLVPYAPVVERHLRRGALSIRELAHAALTTSDNVASNLLLRELGGPQGFTARLREWGDTDTRLDRFEPGLNLVPSGEVRDTTTPRAMAETVARLLAGDLLDARSKQTLKTWMIETRTGLRRLRAGLPEDWEVGDKTGTGIAPGMPNKHNDVAAVWRQQQPPWVIAAFWEADLHVPRMREQDDAVLAEAARLIAAALTATSSQTKGKGP
jgi:beta-lactamase class A